MQFWMSLKSVYTTPAFFLYRRKVSMPNLRWITSCRLNCDSDPFYFYFALEQELLIYGNTNCSLDLGLRNIAFFLFNFFLSDHFFARFSFFFIFEIIISFFFNVYLCFAQILHFHYSKVSSSSFFSTIKKQTLHNKSPFPNGITEFAYSWLCHCVCASACGCRTVSGKWLFGRGSCWCVGCRLRDAWWWCIVMWNSSRVADL